jgi:hypothetical protein
MRAPAEATVVSRKRVLSDLIGLTANLCWQHSLLGAAKSSVSHQRTMLKETVLMGLLLLLTLTGSAWGQALPRDEQQFCSAFPVLREALRQAHVNSIGDSSRQQRQLRQAVSAAAKDFKRSAGWKSPSQTVKGWLGELHSITESTAWGNYVGVSVKLPCADVIVGVPELAVRRWSVSSVDPIATSCVPADPYIGSDTSVFANLGRLSVGQKVTFAGRFCAIPDSANGDVIYFVFSKMSATR